jgi:hypothetical protein
MGAFEDLLSKGAPEPEVHIFLPGKVGTVDKGGDAAQVAGSAAGKPSDSQASSTAPEPEPQLPEGSDPDEPEDPDTAEDDAADAAAVLAAAQEMFKRDPAPAPEAEPEPEDEPEEEGDFDPSGTGQDQPEADGADADSAYPVVPRKGGGLTFDGPSVNLKYFPRVLIEQMREVLKPRLGEDFARDLSQFSLVTAFVIAAMGVELATDEYTAEAVKAFRANDPRTDAIEQRTATLLDQQTKFEGMLKAVLARLGDVTETTAVLEMGQAYALAERTAQLDTSATLPENIDVTQKRVVAARDNIRRRVKTQRQEEKIRSGRPIR